MEPSLHSALHGKIYVDALDKNLTPAELKKEIDSTKQGLGARLVNAVIGIFRSDSKRAAELKKDVVEFKQLLQKVNDLETNKANSPKKELTDAAQKELDASSQKAFKLGMQIGKLWKTPSVRALYLESAVKNAVKDGQAELKELRSKMQEANAEYGSMKNDSHRLGNLLVNNIADMRKEVDGLQKKKEAVSRVLQQDVKIEKLSEDVSKIDFELSDPKFQDAAKRSSQLGEIQRGEVELEELLEKQASQPDDEDLGDLIEVKQAAIEVMKQKMQSDDVAYKDTDVKQLHAERNRLINELEKAKGLLAEAKAERRPFADALRADSEIADLIDELDDLRGKLASLDKSKPEEMAMWLTKYRSDLDARQKVLKEGKQLRADESRYDFQVKMLREREGIVTGLEHMYILADESDKADIKVRIDLWLGENRKLREQLKEESHFVTSREWVPAKDRVDHAKAMLSTLELLHDQYKKVGKEKVYEDVYVQTNIQGYFETIIDTLEPLVAKGPREPAESWEREFTSIATAETIVDEFIEDLNELSWEQTDFENKKNDLINAIEDLKADLTEARGRRNLEFTGDLKEIDDSALEEIDFEIAQKKRKIESLEADLVDITSRPNYDVGAPRPAYHQLLPVEHKILANQLFKGLISQMDEATANLQQLADEISGTAAQADVLQLLKDLEAVKKEVPFDMQAVLKERAEIAVEKEREKRDIPINAMLKNQEAISRLAEDRAAAVDELARLTLERDRLEEEIRDLEAHPEKIKPQDTTILAPQIRIRLQQALDIAKAELKRWKDVKSTQHLSHEIRATQEKIDKAEQNLRAKQRAFDDVRAATERDVLEGLHKKFNSIEEAIEFQQVKIEEREREVRRLDTENRRLEAEIEDEK